MAVCRHHQTLLIVGFVHDRWRPDGGDGVSGLDGLSARAASPAAAVAVLLGKLQDGGAAAIDGEEGRQHVRCILAAVHTFSAAGVPEFPLTGQVRAKQSHRPPALPVSKSAFTACVVQRLCSSRRSGWQTRRSSGLLEQR